jgi:hypothetical protein
MHLYVWLKHALVVAYKIIGSDACSELGQVAIVCVVGLIASALIIKPGDHGFAASSAVCGRVIACD